MKIALVHEFLNQLGGAERVLENFLEIWPAYAKASASELDATVHVILYDKDKTLGRFEEYKKRISWLNALPGVKRHPRLFLILMPGAIEGFEFDDYDVVLSDSSSFAKGANARNKLHICYCHTPTRFLWTEPEYLDYQEYPALLKFFGHLVLPRLKRWDYQAAQKPNFFIANSSNVQHRIKNYYKRDSVVIYPPVDTDFFKPLGEKKNYFFTASRLEPYKKVEAIIEAFNRLGWPLKIAGKGTHMEKLKQISKPNIEFLGRVLDEDLRRLYSEARAFVFAAEEDAGIVLIEANACGTPVIAFKAGGAKEMVKENITGMFFNEQTADSLMEALKNFDVTKFDPLKLREHAEKFSKKFFQQKIKNFVDEKYLEFQKGKL